MKIGVGGKYANLSVKTYLEKLASTTPVPGAGSASALFASLSCALMEMVVNYSSKQNKTIKNAARILKNYRMNFIDLVDEDIIAYNKLSSACKKYGKNSYKIQSALKEATKVPARVCALSCEAMNLTSRLVDVVNKNLISDVGCALSGLSSAFESAKYNIIINIKCITDKRFAVLTGRDIIFLDKKVGRLKKAIIKKVKSIIG